MERTIHIDLEVATSMINVNNKILIFAELAIKNE